MMLWPLSERCNGIPNGIVSWIIPKHQDADGEKYSVDKFNQTHAHNAIVPILI